MPRESGKRYSWKSFLVCGLANLTVDFIERKFTTFVSSTPVFAQLGGAISLFPHISRNKAALHSEIHPGVVICLKRWSAMTTHGRKLCPDTPCLGLAANPVTLRLNKESPLSIQPPSPLFLPNNAVASSLSTRLPLSPLLRLLVLASTLHLASTLRLAFPLRLLRLRPAVLSTAMDSFPEHISPTRPATQSLQSRR